MLCYARLSPLVLYCTSTNVVVFGIYNTLRSIRGRKPGLDEERVTEPTAAILPSTACIMLSTINRTLFGVIVSCMDKPVGGQRSLHRA